MENHTSTGQTAVGKRMQFAPLGMTALVVCARREVRSRGGWSAGRRSGSVSRSASTAPETLDL